MAALPDVVGEATPAPGRTPEIALVEEARRRRARGPTRRELAAAVLTSGTFLGASLAFALFAGSARKLDFLAVALLGLAFAGFSQVEFELGSGSAVPTQLVFVPMLFLLPLPVVPLVVCAGFLLGGACDLIRGRLRAARAVSLVGCAWFSLPPVLVLSAAGEHAPAWSHWPIYLAALLAQFGGDFVHSAAHERLAHRLAPRALLAPLGRVYAFDLLVSPVALLAALSASKGRLSFLGLLPLVAVFVALAHERKARLDGALAAARLDALAHTDALTGLANLRAWKQRLSHLLEQPGEGPLIVCMLDLDHFKAYNDRFGHAAGDALLSGVATAWRQRLRPDEVLARLGGEEFGLALPSSDLEQAAAVVERLRRCMPDAQTCSAGLAQRRPQENIRALTERADAALYAAKQAGRNQSAVAA